MELRCAKCGSEKMIPRINIEDQGINTDGTLRASVGYDNPAARFLKFDIYARFQANICGECGHTELTALDRAGLYAAYVKSKEAEAKSKAKTGQGG